MFTFPTGFFLAGQGLQWSNVRLLIPFAGTNGSTVFTDVSSYARTLTPAGEVNITTSRYPAGATSSAYFRGNNPYQFGGTRDFITVGNSSSLVIGGSDWTVEGYAYIEGSKTDSYSPNAHLIYGRTGPAGDWFFSELLYADSLNRKLGFSTNFSQGSSSFGTITTPDNSIPIGGWFHYAFVKSGTTWLIYINGELKASGGNQHLSTVDYVVNIGAQYNGSAYSYDLKGNLSWLRVCDTALYTQNFTPPTLPFPTGANDPYWNNVVLYLPMTGANGSTVFTDVSKYANPVTRIGDSAISTAQYPALSGVASSGYFDGNGDRLDFSADSARWSFDTQDFTIEFFARISANSSPDADGGRPAGIVYARAAGTTYTSGYELQIMGNSSTTGTGIRFAAVNNAGSFVIAANASATIGQLTWHYCAVKRDAGVLSIWLNGASIYTGSHPQAIDTAANPIRVGGSAFSSYQHFLNGNLSHIRITKGVARDVSTVPTAPFPIG